MRGLGSCWQPCLAARGPAAALNVLLGLSHANFAAHASTQGSVFHVMASPFNLKRISLNCTRLRIGACWQSLLQLTPRTFNSPGRESLRALEDDVPPLFGRWWEVGGRGAWRPSWCARFVAVVGAGVVELRGDVREARVDRIANTARGGAGRGQQSRPVSRIHPAPATCSRSAACP